MIIMSLSGTELKHALRKTDFPFSSREALARVEQLLQNSGRVPNVKHLDLAMEIMAEFVFCEVDRRGTKKRRLSCIQELQLLEVLCDYFAYTSGGSEASRNSVLMSLFPPGHTERSRLFGKLVSMAISTKNTPVLKATGVWMQQFGCTSKVSLELARGLVKDYFVLLPKTVSGLQDLPQLAPQFTANFLTAVAEMYGCDDKKQAFNPPPEALLEVITQWVADNPTLCLAPLMSNLQMISPHGTVSTTPVTPFAGLFKWCVLEPLQSSRKAESALYSRLHLALLESLQECSSLRSPVGDHIVAVEHMIAIVDLVSHCLKDSAPNIQEPTVQLCLDRLAQAVQLALSIQFLNEHVVELLNRLESLPENRLMRIVINKHRKLLHKQQERTLL